MSNETHPNEAALSPREARPSTVPKPAPKRKAATRRTPAQDELAEAHREVKAALEREARATVKVEEENRAVRAKRGHDCMADLVARLDPTARELVIAQVLGVARGDEVQNVQDWVTLLPAKI